MEWDTEVDLVCIGFGAGGLASAISVVDVGGDVFLAPSAGGAAQQQIGTHPWLADTPDVETQNYLAELSADLGPLRRSRMDVDVPIRVAHDPAPAENTRTVPPFVGSKLREWTARCLASPTGYLYTRLSNWQSTPLQTSDGDLIEVAELGTMRVDPGNVGGSLLEWLAVEARKRDIEERRDATLQRIVFEEGMAVGALFDTNDGPLAIRARHGLVVGADSSSVHTKTPRHLPADGTMKVCMVGRYASRFGRVELLTSEPLDQDVPSVCRVPNRQLHANMHETQAHSHVWRCGKMQGYPPLSQ
ncbi:hypothetical protein [Mycobacterium deserti]|uniref:FAD-dependent oxidoreductase 2 FAD binding domain-containing protein n=1 Tax=Mycobacterium deserti TaxID=2978347 RepID=A0ABT2M9X7_9MYCO|nr:hypothetical protein [Mycobacterium deserti]MCT7659054.1 hypothetical protein [Mycobacterium deserti]